MAAAENQTEANRRPFTDSMFTEYRGADPAGFVVSMNLNRRHLTTAQRSLIAADLAKMQRGRPSKGSGKNPQNCGLSTKAAAEQLKVSPRSVETAKAVRKAAPDLAEEPRSSRSDYLLLEAFVRDYSDMAEWKEVIEAIKTQLGAKHV